MAEEVKQGLVKIEKKSEWVQQADAIAALLRAPQLEAAAALAGVELAVLQQWLKEPRFRDRYQAARQAALEEIVARLQQLAAEAVETLARNLTCGVPGVEVEAAKVVLAHARPGADPAPKDEGHG